MSLSDLLNALEKAKASGRKNMVDRAGYSFLQSIGIDPADYNFILLDPEAEPKERGYIISGQQSDLTLEFSMRLEQQTTAIKCELGCGKILLFDGVLLHEMRTVTCASCLEKSRKKETN